MTAKIDNVNDFPEKNLTVIFCIMKTIRQNQYTLKETKDKSVTHSGTNRI